MYIFTYTYIRCVVPNLCYIARTYCQIISSRWCSSSTHAHKQKVGQCTCQSNVIVINGLEWADSQVRQLDQSQRPCAESESWTSALAKQCDNDELSGMIRWPGQERWACARDHEPSQKVGPVHLSSNVVTRNASGLMWTEGQVRKVVPAPETMCRFRKLDQCT